MPLGVSKWTALGLLILSVAFIIGHGQQVRRQARIEGVDLCAATRRGDAALRDALLLLPRRKRPGRFAAFLVRLSCGMESRGSWVSLRWLSMVAVIILCASVLSTPLAALFDTLGCTRVADVLTGAKSVREAVLGEASEDYSDLPPLEPNPHSEAAAAAPAATDKRAAAAAAASGDDGDDDGQLADVSSSDSASDDGVGGEPRGACEARKRMDELSSPPSRSEGGAQPRGAQPPGAACLVYDRELGLIPEEVAARWAEASRRAAREAAARRHAARPLPPVRGRPATDAPEPIAKRWAAASAAAAAGRTTS